MPPILDPEFAAQLKAATLRRHRRLAAEGLIPAGDDPWPVNERTQDLADRMARGTFVGTTRITVRLEDGSIVDGRGRIEAVLLSGAANIRCEIRIADDPPGLL